MKARSALLALALVLALPSAASAHAVVESTTPSRGAQLDKAPSHVTFRFNEPVESTFGALRVFDASGKRVDAGKATHPGGRGDTVSVPVRGGLGDGSYTATYRVISADSHPVSGGFVFRVGTGGPAPAKDVADLIDAGKAGPVTEVAFGAVRGLAYLAIAMAAGGLVFALVAWLPALRELGGAEPGWAEASAAFAGRARRLGLVAVSLGVVTSALGIVLQGATAAGTSFWSALDSTVVSDVLDTRFGTIWGLRLLVWLAVGALLVLPGLRVELPVLRPASLGATGVALGPRVGLARVGLLAAAIGLLVLSPSLAGHASTQHPEAVLVASDVTHVLSMSVWLGGLIALVVAVPAATRRLEGRERTRLLAAVLGRFSTLALAAVCALLATGVLQSILYLDSFGALTSTAFGRAILIKAGLLVCLIGLGAYNRRRSVPRLRRLAQEGEAPGSAGLLLRRALRAEVGLILVVLGVTAALVSYSPTQGNASGPFSAKQEAGPLELELTVDPARVGPNEVHLYLFRRRDGSQFDGSKDLRVSLTQPSRGLGPIALKARKSGPGHYTVQRADVAPGGDWVLTVISRVSDFDEYVFKQKVQFK